MAYGDHLSSEDFSFSTQTRQQGITIVGTNVETFGLQGSSRRLTRVDLTDTSSETVLNLSNLAGRWTNDGTYIYSNVTGFHVSRIGIDFRGWRNFIDDPPASDGIAYGNNRLYRHQSSDDSIVVYNNSGAVISTEGFTLDSANSGTTGMAIQDDTYLYVIDSDDSKVYVYLLTDGSLVSDLEVSLTSTGIDTYLDAAISNNKLYCLYKISNINHGVQVYDILESGAAPVVSLTASPTNVSGFGSVSLTGTYTDEDGGSAFNYAFRAVPNVGAFLITSGSDSTGTVVTTWTAPAALVNARSVVLFLDITDDSGKTGTASQTITVRKATSPNTPSAPTVESTGTTSLKVTYTAPSSGDSPIASYDLRIRASTTTTWTQVDGITRTSIDLINLAPNTLYYVQVRATNAAGLDSNWSSSGTATTDQPAGAPTLSVTVSDSTPYGGDTITATAVASDPNNDPITYSWSATPNLGSFNSTTSAIVTWTAPATTLNARSVRIRCVASDGTLSTRKDVTVTVQANRAPNVSITSPSSNQEVNINETITVSATVSDPDGHAISSYAWSSNGGGSFGDSTARNTTWTSPSGLTSLRVVTLTLTARDSLGTTARDTVSVRVQPNQPPTASISTSSSIVAGGASKVIAATASDTNSDALSYEWTLSPSSSSGTLSSTSGTVPSGGALSTTYTAPAAAVAALAVTLQLRVWETSNTSHEVTASITLTVAAANNPTVVIVTEDQDVDGGEEVELDATATDPDTSDTLTYAWTTDPANKGSFDDATDLEPTWTAPAVTAAEQDIDLILTVTSTDPSDNTVTVTKMITISVAANEDPTVTITAAANVIGGTQIQLGATATDPEDQAITYLWAASPNVGSFDSTTAQNPKWTAPATQTNSQSISITVVATDTLGGTGTASATVIVAGQQPPTVEIETAGTNIVGGTVVSLDATANDPEGHDLTFLWSGPANVGTFSATNTLDTTWTAPASTTSAQIVTLTLKVTDVAGLTASDTVTFTVLAVTEVSQPPTVSIAAAPNPIAGGQLVSLIATVVDPEGETPITYAWTAVPDVGVFANNAVVNTTWRAPAATEADQRVVLTLTATDPKGFSGSNNVAIVVTGTALQLSDFAPGAGRSIDAAALIRSGEPGMMYGITPRPISGSLVDGELGLGAIETYITRIQFLDSGARIRVNDNNLPTALDLTNYFEVERTDLRLHVVTSDDSMTLDITGSAIGTKGGNFINFSVSDTDDQDFLDAIVEDELFIFAFTYPTPVTITKPGAPAAPTIVVNSRFSITANWAAPTVTGGEDPTSYDLRYRQAGTDVWTIVETIEAVTHTITGLLPGFSYEVQVRATNEADDSDWSTSGTVTTTANQTPTVVINTNDTTVAGVADIAISSTVTDADGDAVIIVWSDGGAAGTFDNIAIANPIYTTPAATATAQTITLTVSVNDAYGVGGTDTVTITVSQLPDQLVLSDVDASQYEVEVLWLGTSGSPQSNIYYDLAGYGTIIEGDYAIDNDTDNVTRLRFVSQTSFSTRGGYIIGVGFSSPSPSISSHKSTWTDGYYVLVINDQKAIATFPITDDSIHNIGNNFVNFLVPTDLQAIVASVGGGERYIFGIVKPTDTKTTISLTAAATLPAITAAFAVTIRQIVTIPAIADRDFDVGEAISFVLPNAASGVAPYTRTVAGLPTGLAYNNTNRTISGQVNTAGTHTITYTITDDNSNTASVTFDIVISAVTPQVPTGLASSAQTGTTITMGWTVGTSAENTVLEWREDGTTQWTTATITAPTATYTVTGLSALTDYEFQAKSTRTGAVDSAYTTIVDVSTTGLDAAASPDNLASSNIEDDSYDLSWDASTNADSYTLEIKGPTDADFVEYATGITGTSQSVTGRNRGTKYENRVKAIRANAPDSAYSNVLNVTTDALEPEAPTANRTSVGNGIIIVSWTASADDGGSPITKYYIEYRQGSSGSWTEESTEDGTARAYTIRELTNGTSYQVRIIAENIIGRSPESNILTATPTLTVPSPDESSEPEDRKTITGRTTNVGTKNYQNATITSILNELANASDNDWRIAPNRQLHYRNMSLRNSGLTLSDQPNLHRELLASYNFNWQQTSDFTDEDGNQLSNVYGATTFTSGVLDLPEQLFWDSQYEMLGVVFRDGLGYLTVHADARVFRTDYLDYEGIGIELEIGGQLVLRQELKEIVTDAYTSSTYHGTNLDVDTLVFDAPIPNEYFDGETTTNSMGMKQTPLSTHATSNGGNGDACVLRFYVYPATYTEFNLDVDLSKIKNYIVVVGDYILNTEDELSKGFLPVLNAAGEETFDIGRWGSNSAGELDVYHLTGPTEQRDPGNRIPVLDTPPDDDTVGYYVWDQFGRTLTAKNDLLLPDTYALYVYGRKFVPATGVADDQFSIDRYGNRAVSIVQAGITSHGEATRRAKEEERKYANHYETATLTTTRGGFDVGETVTLLNKTHGLTISEPLWLVESMKIAGLGGNVRTYELTLRLTDQGHAEFRAAGAP